jgi:orotate phosphoribosyltransferase-like protein
LTNFAKKAMNRAQRYENPTDSSVAWETLRSVDKLMLGISKALADKVGGLICKD